MHANIHSAGIYIFSVAITIDSYGEYTIYAITKYIRIANCLAIY